MWRLNSFWAIVFVVTLTNVLALAQTHFTFTSNTGNNATVAIPVAANPNISGTPLATGDEIGVFTPAGLCVGATVWTIGLNAAITVWGDNDQTPAIDGIQAGQQMNYRVWRQSTNTEYTNVSVTYSIGNGIYAVDGIYALASLTAIVVSVDGPAEANVLKDYLLHQNHPNPFNPSTAIGFQIPAYSFVTLKVHDALGQDVATVVNEQKSPGRYEVNFEASGLPSGLYFYSLQVSNPATGLGQEVVKTKRMLLLR
jgi:hypothetical protein